MDNVIQGNFGGQTTGGGPPPAPPDEKKLNLVRYQVWSLRHTSHLKTRDARIRALFNFIWHQEIEKDRGAFIVADGRPYLLDGKSRHLYNVGMRNEPFIDHLFDKYGLLKTENLTTHVVAALESAVRTAGRQREARRFVYFDRRSLTLYVSKYNGTAYRLTGESKCEPVPNGSGVLFMDDDDGKVCDPDPFIAHFDGGLIKTLFNEVSFVSTTQGGLSPKHQKLAMTIWLFMLAFPDLMRSKPMLLVEGEAGSGKTTLIKMVQAILRGKSDPQVVNKRDEVDFPIKLLRSPICLLDNLDTFVDWLQDGLCAYTTEGQWTRRKLYTDDATITLRPQSFLAITSRNPMTFKRDDVADRCIILRMQRRDANTPEETLFHEINTYRAELYGEWLYWVNRIVKVIRANGGPTIKNRKNTHRMADFANMAHIIGMGLGQPADDIDEMLIAIQSEREALVAEGDPLPDLLDRWLETTNNAGRRVTANDLHADLSELAKKHNKNFYKSVNTLSNKLRGNPTLDKLFSVREVGYRANAKVYEIRRR